jgi:hypothetical protein
VAFVIYGFLFVLKGERFMIRKNVCEEGKKIVYVCMCVLFINLECVQIKKHGRTLCVAGSDSWRVM